MNENIEILKQSIQNYTLPVLDEIMIGHYDPGIISTIIKARLMAEYAKDQRIEQVVDIIITEDQDSFKVSSILQVVNYSEPIEV